MMKSSLALVFLLSAAPALAETADDCLKHDRASVIQAESAIRSGLLRGDKVEKIARQQIRARGLCISGDDAAALDGYARVALMLTLTMAGLDR